MRRGGRDHEPRCRHAARSYEILASWRRRHGRGLQSRDTRLDRTSHSRFSPPALSLGPEQPRALSSTRPGRLPPSPPAHLRAVRHRRATRARRSSSWNTWPGETLADRAAARPLALGRGARLAAQSHQAPRRRAQARHHPPRLKPGNVMLDDRRRGATRRDDGEAGSTSASRSTRLRRAPCAGWRRDGPDAGLRSRQRLGQFLDAPSITWRPSRLPGVIRRRSRTDLFAMGAVLLRR